MRKDPEKYRYKTVHRVKDAQKLLRKGWEMVDSSGSESWVWGSNYKALLRKER